MQDFEQLGVFYLGRPYDPAKKKPKPGWLLYDSKDLVTHAVCVGMTGSGKTGLCIGLLEEAAIDGIPALVIDPKGDLANLLLTFPQLRGEDFAPWVNEDDARKRGLSPTEYAQQQAELWKKGLAEWGQDGTRIRRLRDAAEFVVYTPGSTAGLPVSILNSFAAPSRAVLDEVEALRERIGTTTTGLLGLLGIEADPVKSREHILVSTILETAWKQGQDLDLATLIRQIQAPPVSHVGVLDLESFYPAKDRFALAMQLNNLLAAPGFSVWLEGDALDIGRLLYTSEGKPRIAIFSIAHLSDAERMFFVTLLLSQTLGWARSQAGTTSLRAILYMDEIFGYFPPVANPPSKQPLLTLLKQARAFGLGVVLATQNPVDLDYKGLANTGTWFIGRLQTERDKARVLEGLEGAAAGGGRRFDRQRMEQLLAGLGSRIFLMHNVHEDAPVVFETRWTLSYLRGPLTRTQIKTLMDPYKASGVRREASGADYRETSSGRSPRTPHPSRFASTRPVLPPDIPHYFLPVRGFRPTDADLIYQPKLLGVAQIRVADRKVGVEFSRDYVFLAPVTDAPVPVDWDDAVEADVAVADLERMPQDPARYEPLPSPVANRKSFDRWSKEFANWLYRTQKVELLRSPSLKEVSKPGESEREFRIRLHQLTHERRDQVTEQLRKKYGPKMAALQERLRRAEQAKEREAEQAKAQHLQTAISFGATLLGAFLGRKTISATTLGKATTAARGVGRSIKEAKDVARAEENIEAIRKQLDDLERQFQAETDTLMSKIDPLTEPLETIALRPTKTDIAVRLVSLAWAPHWIDQDGRWTPAWR
ncbi:MAG: ATP-binding protein [Nitrospiraceae bacterium]|nr:MAG: ATP-binding protein [Nitrospiraceae bacterium]